MSLAWIYAASLAAVSLFAYAEAEVASGADQGWLNLAATIVFSVMASLIGFVYRDLRKQVAASAKDVKDLRADYQRLCNLHDLLLGFVPGASGGMVDDVRALKLREREMTSEIFEMKAKYSLLERELISEKSRPKKEPRTE